MDEEVRKQWIEALRSGDYKQGQGSLVQEYVGEKKYCCLGVLCLVVGVEPPEKESYLPPEILEKSGFKIPPEPIPEGYDLYADGVSLISCNDFGPSVNDVNRETFKEIADRIEKAERITTGEA